LAFTYFARATEIEPEDTAAGLNTATVLLQAGVFEQAEKHFRRVLGVEPDSEAALLGLAAALRGQGRRDKQGPFQAAEKVLSGLLAASPGHWAAAHNLAVLYAESLDRPADATAHYVRFLGQAPADHPARERAKRWVDEHAAPVRQANPQALE
jgi:tetratricopeptide (TPR) repeat protein